MIEFSYVLIGRALFLAEFEKVLFPLGEIMAKQLIDQAFITGADTLNREPFWGNYLSV